MIRVFLSIAGMIVLAPPAFALSAPTAPDALSPYVLGIFDHVENDILGPVTVPPAPCSPSDAADAAVSIREILFDIDAAVVLPQEDVARSVCFRSDIESLEWYLNELIAMAVSSCGVEQKTYRDAVEYVWDKLRQLRRFGLDPRVQAPVRGAEVESVPPGAAPLDDDELCPYYSPYAATGIAQVGCQALLPSASPTQLFEMLLMSGILGRIGVLGASGLTAEFTALSAATVTMRSNAEQFVRWVSLLRFPGAVPPFPPVFSLRTVPNAGESGCLGWPSDVVSGPVTGENIPRQPYDPSELVLTKELRDVIAYLRERENVRWYEYHRALLEGEEGTWGQLSAGRDAMRLNREHLGRESSSILSIRDPQKRMESIANHLHAKTREFANEAAPLPGSYDPPLRDFVRRYAEFLSRMCVNRGCGDTLMRSIELSLRDECFSSFLMQPMTSAGTLRSCRAIYTGP